MPVQRFAAVDTLRGVAMLWMTLFHFCFDLNQFGYWRQDFYSDPVWTWQRTAILSLFLLAAGAGQAIAVHQQQSWPRFWMRWRQVAVAALLVSAGSYWMFPKTYIYFGVLHGMAVMLVIVRLTAHWGRLLWLLGGFAIALYFVANYVHLTGTTAHLFDSKALNWLGWVSRKPATEDYVPLIPWLGVMWCGAAGAQSLLRHRPQWLAGLGGERTLPVRWLAVLGRWSLSYYLLHQPVMIGVLTALAWFKTTH